MSHVALAFVHVFEHGFGSFSPDLIVSTVTKQTDGYNDVILCLLPHRPSEP